MNCDYNVDIKTITSVKNIFYRSNIDTRVIENDVSCINSKNISSSQLPKKEELKTVVDKVKDFFGEVTSGAKESFAQITGTASTEAEAEAQAEDEKPRSKRRSKRKGKQQKPKQGFSK